jgi:Xaa-Pro dipeptidase
MNHLKRIGKLQESLCAHGLEGAILFWSRDIYYYTGLAVPAWLALRGDDWKLYIRSGMDYAAAASTLPPGRICAQRKLDLVCREMFPGGGAGQKVGSELDIMPMNQVKGYQSALGSREMVDISPIILAQRAVKDPDEVAQHRLAAQAAQAGHLAALEMLRPGISELEFAAAMEHGQRLAGHEGTVFFRWADTLMGRGPMSSGPNLARHTGTVFTLTGVGLSPALPAGAGQRVIQSGDLVFTDIPACVQGYHMDQGRMYCAGKAPARAHELYAVLLEIEDYLMRNLRPGMEAGEGYQLAIQKVAELGMAEHYLRLGPELKATFVGHSVGLEINEPPVMIRGNQTELEAGMVLAIEQHFMEPDGLTVKLEDLVLLGDEGCELLSVTPRKITEKG